MISIWLKEIELTHYLDNNYFSMFSSLIWGLWLLPLPPKFPSFINCLCYDQIEFWEVFFFCTYLHKSLFSRTYPDLMNSFNKLYIFSFFKSHNHNNLQGLTIRKFSASLKCRKNRFSTKPTWCELLCHLFKYCEIFPSCFQRCLNTQSRNKSFSIPNQSQQCFSCECSLRISCPSEPVA